MPNQAEMDSLEVTALNNLARECSQIAEDHGFHDVAYEQFEASMITSLTLIASEVYEALDTYRKRYEIGQDDARNAKTGMTGRQTVSFLDELADIVIRTFDLAGKNHLNIGQAIIDKMDKNRGRPYLHGKTF